MIPFISEYLPARYVLRDWFNTPFDELPPAIQERAKADVFLPVAEVWDRWSADDRRAIYRDPDCTPPIGGPLWEHPDDVASGISTWEVEEIQPRPPATALCDITAELPCLPEETHYILVAPSKRLRAMEKCDDWHRLLEPLILELVERLDRRPYPDEVWNAAIKAGCEQKGKRAEDKELISRRIDKPKSYSSFKRTYPTWWED